MSFPADLCEGTWHAPCSTGGMGPIHDPTYDSRFDPIDDLRDDLRDDPSHDPGLEEGRQRTSGGPSRGTPRRAFPGGGPLVAALIVGLACLLGVATHLWENDQGRHPPGSVAKLSQADRAFLRDAQTVSFTTIMASRLAVKESRDTELKDFARHLIDAQSPADEALQALARRKGVVLARSDAGPQETMLADLRGLKAQAFERAYTSEVGVVALRRGLTLFEQEESEGSDPDVRAYAETNVAAWQAYLVGAEQLRATVARPAT